MDSINPDHLTFPKTSSNLSPYFQNLILKQCLSEHQETEVLARNGLLNFEYISACLPESKGPESDSPEYFTESVKVLAPMLTSVEEWMMSKEETFIHNSLSDWTSWTNQQKMMTDLFTMMFEDDDISDITILLATTAILERALGDIYLIKGPPPCPSMLKDLLVSRPLIELLGDSVIQVLRLLIGPPISLNIRNVVWHGFPLPGEIPRRCIWFILALVPSIGHVLHKSGIKITKHREPVSFPEVSLILEQDLLHDDPIIQRVSTSQFVGWNTQQFWYSVRGLYQDGKYSLCAALLSYYLEQGLRRVFAVVNKCENRILTAESSTLFTTFDEILCPFLPDNTENKLRHVVTDSVMEILLDHLVYQDGPRFRDRLSHGEADWFSFPKPLTDNLITVCLALALRFNPDRLSDKYDKMTDLQTSIQGYQVQFHRISLIKKLVYQLYKEASAFDCLILINTDLTKRKDGSAYQLSEDHLQFEDQVKTVCNEIVRNWTNHSNIQQQGQIVQSMTYHSNDNSYSVMEDLLQSKIQTLFRETNSLEGSTVTQVDGESEILSILNHVMSECLTTLTHLRTFSCLRQEQLRDKQLRSRQRENFKKFLQSFPSYIVCLKLYGYMVTWQLYHLDGIKTQSSQRLAIMIRSWKSLLQCCENLRTCTHPDKNKWTEGLELVNKHVIQLVSNVNKLLIMYT